MTQSHTFALVINPRGGARLEIKRCPGVHVGGCLEYDPETDTTRPENGCVMQSWVDALDAGDLIDHEFTITFDGIVGFFGMDEPHIDIVEPEGSQ